MPIAPETTVGPYLVAERIAVGGMGEVYRGWHTQLDRAVAIKVIGESSLDDPAAIKRFAREAKLASNLDHPHICRVFDYLEHENRPLLVLEFCEGETLEEFLKHSRPPIEQVIQIGIDVADALEHAHSHGLIHRDLKPSNIMLTPSGAKILDFGLVKQAPTASGYTGSGGTATESLTGEDAPIGTLPYMAPEQLRGEEADARSDLYALGVILFEMLSGRLLFVKKTNAAMLAAILRDPAPPLQSVVPTVPAVLAHLVDRCLAKDPADRWGSASVLAGEFRWLASTGASPVMRRNRKGLLESGFARTVFAALILLGVWILWPRGRDQSGQVLDTVVMVPAGFGFIANHQEAVISPDGESILFSVVDSSGENQLWVRRLADQRAERIESATGAHTPFWSPDGDRVGYFVLNELLFAEVRGGPSERLGRVSLESRGASWGADDVILFAPDRDSGLFSVSPGGTPRRLTTPDPSREEIGHMWPTFLPDGERYVYLIASTDESVQGIYLASLSEPRGTRVVAAASSGAFANGYLLFLRDDALLAQPLDPGSGILTGRPTVLAESVASTGTLQSAFSASTNGVLTYSGSDSKDITELVWRDLNGAERGRIGVPRRHRNPTLSPDGRLLAVEVLEGGRQDIWTFDLGTGNWERTGEASLRPGDPIWAPDGTRLVFASPQPTGWALYSWDQRASTGPVEVATSSTQMMPTDWTPDGHLVLYADRTARGDYDISALDTRDGSGRTLLGAEWAEFGGRLSPDGARLAYVSDRSDPLESFEVWVTPFPSLDGSCRVSSAGGFDPAWGADNQLFYLDPVGTVMVSVLEASDGCPSSPPEVLFDARTGNPRRARNHYAYAPAERQLLVNAMSNDPRARMVSVLINWPARIDATGQ